MNFVGPVADNRAFADVSPFTAANARALVDEFGNVALGPAGRLNDVAQLFWNHDGVIPAIDRIVTLVGAHLGGEGFENLFGIGGPLIHDLPRRESPITVTAERPCGIPRMTDRGCQSVPSSSSAMQYQNLP